MGLCRVSIASNICQLNVSKRTMQAGKYRFSDYPKFGAGMTVLVSF